ncbi:MAG: hypothetical protein H6983_18255 [Ectothiorhodospiraceae bacterium]|nr:hypothetical protein [Ectothiorhodospiraceae bacterium]
MDAPSSPLIVVDVHPAGAASRPWSLAIPDAVLAATAHRSFRLSVAADGFDERELTPLVAAVSEVTGRGGAPLLLLGGSPPLQLALMSVLQTANLCSKVRSVLRVAAWHRPFLPSRQPFVHGLIVDAEPTAAERARWARALGRDIAGRVCRVSWPTPVPTPHEPGDGGTGAAPRVTMVSFEADQWTALGVQAFAIWARGRYRHCRRCRAVNLDRFHPHLAHFEPRTVCLHCGADGLVEARAPTAARLDIAFDRGVESSPDPQVLAAWLGIADMVEPRPLPAGGDVAGLATFHAAGDIALVLGDPAYPDSRLAAARASGARVVTNAPSSAMAACHGWDSHGQVTAHTSLRALVRALEAAMHGAGEGVGRVDDSSAVAVVDVVDAWRDAITRLERMPRPRVRLIGRRALG